MNLTDSAARKKIGYDYVIDNLETVCVYGRELTAQLGSVKREALTDEYENIEKCLKITADSALLGELTGILSRFKDIHGTFKRCAAGETLDEVELFELKGFSWLNMRLAEQQEIKLKGIDFPELSGAFSLLNPGASPTAAFHISSAYSMKLKEIRARKRIIEQQIYEIPETEKRRAAIARRALVADEEKQEEYEIRKRLSAALSKFCPAFLKAADSAGRLDLTLAKARMAKKYNAVRPVLSDHPCIRIKGGVNPLAIRRVTEQGGRFYPLDMELTSGASVLTGANMGGKTVALATVALNFLLASQGFYAFATYFEFSPLDFISFVSGDVQSLDNGLSTFGGEIIMLKKILRRAETEDGLLLFDEFARGTNPYEGACLARALVQYLGGLHSVALLATHYDGVGEYAGARYRVRGLKKLEPAEAGGAWDDARCIEIIRTHMDYTVEKDTAGAGVPKDALNICRLAGAPAGFLAVAEKMYREEPGG